MDPAHLPAISRLGKTRKFDAGNIIFSAGQRFRKLYLVLSGLVEVSTFNPPDGRSILVGIFGEGEPLGVAGLFGQQVHFVDCICLRDTIVLGFDRKTALQIIRNHPEIAASCIQVLGERLANVTDQLRDTSLECVEERLLRALQRLARDSGAESPVGMVIDLPLSQQNLARMIGCSRESVNRAMAPMLKRGTLRRFGRRYVIDPPTWSTR